MTVLKSSTPVTMPEWRQRSETSTDTSGPGHPVDSFGSADLSCSRRSRPDAAVFLAGLVAGCFLSIASARCEPWASGRAAEMGERLPSTVDSLPLSSNSPGQPGSSVTQTDPFPGSTSTGLTSDKSPAPLFSAPSDCPDLPPVRPPELNERRLPRTEPLPGPATSGRQLAPKPPLAWRHRALNTYKTEPTTLFDASFADVLMSAISACCRLDWRVDSVNSNAGEILASIPAERPRQAILSVAEAQPGKTSLWIAVEKGDRLSELELADLLDEIRQLLSKRGRI